MEDTRNVIDKYKGWTNEAIVADLDQSRVDLEVAIENLAHDFNMGTVVRNANAFNVRAVHIIGKKHYNRRGAMATDKYLHIFHHDSADEFAEDVRARGYQIVGVENNVENARPLNTVQFAMRTVLVFGSESAGLSADMLRLTDQIVQIEQLGSTRSVNVGVASGIVMYQYLRKCGILDKYESKY
ncbi:MAG: rRNA methyltransferase [Candidatus Nomurabacteria bacterium]|jgi:tRNA G18 (ribose-2'-O)-methylase SpoU|nr:rRNA methyltransferase [Candidatus Nomurabacteria bacterium]